MDLRQQLTTAARSATSYLARNPQTLAQMARHAFGLRIAVPLDAIRWAVAQLPTRKAPTDIVISARPPAIHVGATVDLMGCKLRANSSVTVQKLYINSDEMRLTFRVSNLDLKVQGSQELPLAKMINSGALDLKRPANLLKFMPKKSPALVSADDDLFAVDLLKVDKLKENEVLRRVLSAVTPVLNIAAVGTEGDMLIVSLFASPGGIREAFAALRG